MQAGGWNEKSLILLHLKLSDSPGGLDVAISAFTDLCLSPAEPSAPFPLLNNPCSPCYLSGISSCSWCAAESQTACHAIPSQSCSVAVARFLLWRILGPCNLRALPFSQSQQKFPQMQDSFPLFPHSFQAKSSQVAELFALFQALGYRCNRSCV